MIGTLEYKAEEVGRNHVILEGLTESISDLSARKSRLQSALLKMPVKRSTILMGGATVEAIMQAFFEEFDADVLVLEKVFTKKLLDPLLIKHFSETDRIQNYEGIVQENLNAFKSQADVTKNVIKLFLMTYLSDPMADAAPLMEAVDAHWPHDLLKQGLDMLVERTSAEQSKAIRINLEGGRNADRDLGNYRDRTESLEGQFSEVKNQRNILLMAFGALAVVGGIDIANNHIAKPTTSTEEVGKITPIASPTEAQTTIEQDKPKNTPSKKHKQKAKMNCDELQGHQLSSFADKLQSNGCTIEQYYLTLGGVRGMPIENSYDIHCKDLELSTNRGWISYCKQK